MPSTTRERFEQALADLMEEVQEDRHILAGILCGSLSHDEVWDKSDIDLVLVCTDDQKTGVHGVALTMDDINIHTSVEPRAQFRLRLEASTRNMFGHSMYAKGRLLFSRDPSIDRLFAQLQDIGARDTEIQVMNSVIHALTTHYKARKWHEVKDDVAYTALWILQTARALAEAEVGLAGEIVGREALADAVRLNPALYGPIYLDLLEGPATAAANGVALDAIDAWLEPRARQIFAPLLEYLEVSGGEPRSTTEISHHFTRNHNVEHILMACEWLSDIGVIEKASTPVKLTTRSQVEVEELAFFAA